ncbi:MAG: hypothetical protein Q8P84_04425, partial [Deltaproteobacteria bacterium]|nr:hypothetical protein [Deltaproteobacteria bacterium]
KTPIVILTLSLPKGKDPVETRQKSGFFAEFTLNGVNVLRMTNCNLGFFLPPLAPSVLSK